MQTDTMVSPTESNSKRGFNPRIFLLCVVVITLSVGNIFVSGPRWILPLIVVSWGNADDTTNDNNKTDSMKVDGYEDPVIELRNNAKKKDEKKKKRGRFNSTTRALQVAVHHRQAIEKVKELQEEYPVLNLKDLLDTVMETESNITASPFWTPATVENIIHARRYHYYVQQQETLHQHPNNTNNTAIKKIYTIKKYTSSNAYLHFVSHIPKTGLAYGARLLSRFFFSNPLLMTEMARLRRQDYNTSINITPTTVPTFRSCDFGTGKPGFYHSTDGIHKGSVCTLWVAEQPRSQEFRYGYTLIRNPREHVLSQFFHCKESRPHRKDAHHMPKTLTEWLEAWVKKSKIDQLDVGQLGIDKQFLCYDPRNLQSTYTKFASEQRQKSSLSDPTTTTAATAGNNVATNHEYDFARAKQDLKERFDVIGLTERTVQSMCLIAIRFTGWVPPRCDCTDIRQEEDFMNSNTTITGVINTIKAVGRSHGVEHHGATYPTTANQDALLDELTQWDQRLYELAQEIFWERLIETEHEYGVKICDDLRTDIRFDGLPQ